MSVVIALTDDIAACRALRRAVFMDEQGISEADEMDDLDPVALHILACDDGTPVGTARLLLAAPVGKIGRVCVLASHRGRGLGAGLIRAAEEVLRTRPGVTTARLGAQLHALGFYEKLGYAAHGPAYDDAGIPHRTMDRPL